VAAVDYGPRRVGLAMTDGLSLAAHPVGTFSPDAALERLHALHAAHGLARILVGWPLGPGDTEGPAVARVRPSLGRLRRAFPDVPVEPYDERDTSREAAAALHAAGRWRAVRRDRGRLDAAAACVLLEHYLEEAAGLRTGVRGPTPDVRIREDP
jgi:putative holliday junction resolvase